MNDLELLCELYEEAKKRYVPLIRVVLENKERFVDSEHLTDSYLVFGETSESENNLVVLDKVNTAESHEAAFEHFKSGMLEDQRTIMTSREVRVVKISPIYRYVVDGEIGDD